jgi:hypothetical protein
MSGGWLVMEMGTVFEVGICFIQTQMIAQEDFIVFINIEN